MLHETHPFLSLKSQLSFIKSIELDINKNILDNPAVGKRKKGAYKLEPDTTLVTIQVKLEKEGKIEELNFPIGANLYGTIIEINKKIIDKPELLFDKYNTEAYIAIILPTLAKSPINDPPVEMVGKNRKEKEKDEEDTNDNNNLIETKSSKLSKYDKRRVKYNQQLIKDAENINHPLITLKIPIFIFEGQSLDEE
ncbi:hypothetical protein K502DRAFT_323406 [Neoconidiobolus thromboides FSU 785]|nr:hypothetical protein K502DRAFT_323406 [Neoconidiobolus thromboides FSU 785]